MPLKLSIIIPVYNVEPYLAQCLDSLVGQSMAASDYEILCVDDGSTDASPQILARYAAANENLRAIRQANAGASAARNRALDLAAGEYVLFVDGDDCLTRADALEALYTRAAARNLDELHFCAEARYDSEDLRRGWAGAQLDFNGDYPEDEVLRGQQLFVRQLRNHDFTPYLWRRLYRRAFLEANALRFLVGNVFEDLPYVAQCMSLSERSACCALRCYGYRIRENSVTRQKFARPYPGLYGRLIGTRQMQRFIRERLANADGEFRFYLKLHFQDWACTNAEQYLRLSPRARAGFWRWVPRERKDELKRWMRADIRFLRERKVKRAIRRMIPNKLRAWMKGRKSQRPSE